MTMNIKKLPSNSAALIVLIVIAILLAGAYAYFLVSLSKRSDKQRDFAGDIKDAASIIREEEGNRQVLATHFLKDGEQALFVSEIEASCVRLSVDCVTRSLNEEPDAVSPDIKILKVVISAEGAFRDVMQLVASFEKGSYPIEISRSGLFATDDAWEGMFELSLPVAANLK